MPLQNRVLPTGDIVAHPARGGFTGNRGILHKADGRLGIKRWQHQHWVCCQLEFRGRYHGPMPKGGWTALFFLDEAVALAAGHRPCHFCRYKDAMRFKSLWGDVHGRATAAEMDRILHPKRVTRTRQQVRHRADAAGLPDGTFILHPDTAQPGLVLGDAIFPYSPAGYAAPLKLSAGLVDVLTPAPILPVLAAGYRPQVHATMTDSGLQ